MALLIKNGTVADSRLMVRDTQIHSHARTQNKTQSDTCFNHLIRVDMPLKLTCMCRMSIIRINIYGYFQILFLFAVCCYDLYLCFRQSVWFKSIPFLHTVVITKQCRPGPNKAVSLQICLGEHIHWFHFCLLLPLLSASGISLVSY